MMIFVITKEGDNIAIPSKQIFNISQKGNQIHFYYQCGDYDIFSTTLAIPRVTKLTKTFANVNDANKKMRNYFIACRDNLQAFCF